MEFSGARHLAAASKDAARGRAARRPRWSRRSSAERADRTATAVVGPDEGHQARRSRRTSWPRSTPSFLTVEPAPSSCRFYRNLKLVKTYTVAVGAVGFETPAGLYHVQNKAIDPAWHVPDSDWAGDLPAR